MPHVSSKKLNEKLYTDLFTQLAQAVSNLSEPSSGRVLAELLTDTERVMVSKRLAAALMFDKHLSQYAIERVLKLSSSTVSRLHRSYRAGHFDTSIRQLKKRTQDHEKMWKVIELLIRGGMPSRGKKRWQHLPR